jgi:hypothetical protein
LKILIKSFVVVIIGILTIVGIVCLIVVVVQPAGRIASTAVVVVVHMSVLVFTSFSV